MTSSLLRVGTQAELPRTTLRDVRPVADLEGHPTLCSTLGPLGSLESWLGLLATASSSALALIMLPPPGNGTFTSSPLLPLCMSASKVSLGTLPPAGSSAVCTWGRRGSPDPPSRLCTTKAGSDPTAGRAWRSGVWMMRTSIKIQNVPNSLGCHLSFFSFCFP